MQPAFRGLCHPVLLHTHSFALWARRMSPASLAWPTSAHSFPVLVAQLRLFADQGDFLAVDEDVLHIGLYVQGIAIRDYHVGTLANIERAKLFIQAPDLRGIERDCLERLIVRQTKA